MLVLLWLGCLLFLGGDLLKPFDHTEHYGHSHNAYHEEHQPAHPEFGHVFVQHRAEEDEEVSDGSGAKPQTLADSLNMLRGNLRHKAQTERADEELGHGEEEVGYDKNPGADLL